MFIMTGLFSPQAMKKQAIPWYILINEWVIMDDIKVQTVNK